MKFSFYSILLAATLFLFSCGGSDVELSYTNLEEEVPTVGNFTFQFSQDVAPDSILHYWEETPYVEFSPEIEGYFKWVNNNELIFSPDQPLPPSTAFEAELTEEIVAYSDEFDDIGSETLEFYTPLLRLYGMNVYWFLNPSTDASEVRMDVDFNYTVNPEDIEDALLVKVNDEKVNDEKVDFELLDDNNTSSVTFLLEEIAFEDADYEVSIVLEDGLIPLYGSIGTKEPIEEFRLLKSPFKIEISDVIANHDGSTGTIDVITSQEISERDLKDFIKISPSIAYNLTTTPSGFTIKSSSFSAAEKYTLTLKEGLQGKVGGKLPAEYSQDIAFGELEPDIYFENDKAFYLSGNGNKNIQVKIVNIPEVKVIVSKLYENNILSAQDYGSYSDYWYDNHHYNDYGDDYYYDYYYYSELQLEDIIFERTYSSADFEKSGGVSLLNLDLEDELKDFNGVYHVEVQSTEDYWLSDSRLLSISDIGLIAKKGQNNMLVFANSLSTAEALENVKVKVYGKNNQVIAEGTTGVDGVVEIALKNKEYSGFSPSMITAEKYEDFNVMVLRETYVNTSRFDVGGYRDAPNGLQTFIYPERDLYRPGEEVHFATIVRNQNWLSPGELPVKVEIKLPNGKVLKTLKKTLNEEGSFDADFKVESSSPTGWYSIYVYSSNDVLLASKGIMVEEFMPDRIRVNTTFSDEELEIGETTELSIQADNLFGTPAANRSYEVEWQWKRRYFSPENYRNYNFNIANTYDYFDTEYREGDTDENGTATEEFDVPYDYEDMGMLQADVFTTVFDETGRPVNRKNVIEVYTQDAFYGIGDFDYYSNTNSQMNIPLVAVDKDGNVANVKARVQIIKHEYKTVLNKSGGYFRYESNKVEKIMSDETITLNGEKNYSFVPPLSGKYEIRVYNPEVNGRYVTSRFYAYSYGQTYLSSFEVNNEGNVDVEFSKENYEVGDKAKILFTTPFQGKMLVTVEGRDVLKYFYIETDKRSAEITLDITEDFLPNAYVSATLFKPHDETEFPLTVAHGFKSMRVDDPKRDIPVEIKAVEDSRSNTTQTIKVKSYPNSKVSIAVVDEGILQVSGFQTPEPYDYFYQNRALQVNSYDVYPYLFPEISASTAGGDGFNMDKRVNPMDNKRVKLVSFWSGIVETNNNGEATYEIDIPQFSGSLRIMAVSHKGNSFGAAAENMTVADPIVISSTIPRFLSPGDTAVVISTLMNTEDKSASAKSSISVTGNLKVVGENKINVSIGEKKEARVIYKIVANQEIGTGKITVKCDAFGETFKEETDISVRPASPLLKETVSGSIAAGKTEKLDVTTTNFIESSADYKLVVSKNPMIEFAEDLDYLVRYPYGCTEQTISAAFPQLYFNDISKALYQNDKMAEDVNQNILQAIDRLKLRQLYNGGLVMWSGNGTENWWVTAYGAHFLIEAEKAGYDIDEDFLEYCLGYLSNRLKNKETITYYYNRTQNKKIAPKEVAYSLYVLALADEADVSLMNYYKSNSTLLSLDSRYLLAAAYALAGDVAKGKEILPNNFEGEESVSQFGGSFYSVYRDEAMALNALLEIDPDHQQIGTMVKHVSENLKQNRYMNTQERIFSLLALGKIAKKANASDVEATIKVDGKVVGNYDNTILSLGTDKLQGDVISIEVKGDGDLYYFWEAEGISKDGSFKEEDNYLKVRKTFYDRYGKEITGNTFQQNDLIVVKLSIQNTYSTTVENVVISDILPAGFEIENPRTDEIPGTEWITGQTYPDFRDIRDDRINLFDDVYASSYTQDYYYVVRAVSTGTFHMGPVGADAMYNGEYHSYNGGGIIKIVEKE